MKEGPWEYYYRSGASHWRSSPHGLPDLTPGSRVLDIGCGTGSTLIKAAEKGSYCTGLDISATALSTAEERLTARGLRADLVACDITRGLPSLGRFDLVIMHYVLGSLFREGRENVALSILDILEPGGLVSFEDLAVSDIRDGKGTLVEDRTYIKGNGISQHFFNLEEVHSLFDSLDAVETNLEEWTHGSITRKRIRATLRSR